MPVARQRRIAVCACVKSCVMAEPVKQNYTHKDKLECKNLKTVIV